MQVGLAITIGWILGLFVSVLAVIVSVIALLGLARWS
jgi:hypothetical protein